MPSVLKKLYGVCYGPHRDGQDPTKNMHPNKMEMNQDVVFLSKLTKRIRTYSSQSILNVIKNLDKNKMQLNLGVSLDVSNPVANDIEISTAKNLLARYVPVKSSNLYLHFSHAYLFSIWLMFLQ